MCYTEHACRNPCGGMAGSPAPSLNSMIRPSGFRGVVGSRSPEANIVSKRERRNDNPYQRVPSDLLPLPSGPKSATPDKPHRTTIARRPILFPALRRDRHRQISAGSDLQSIPAPAVPLQARRLLGSPGEARCAASNGREILLLERNERSLCTLWPRVGSWWRRSQRRNGRRDHHQPRRDRVPFGCRITRWLQSRFQRHSVNIEGLAVRQGGVAWRCPPSISSVGARRCPCARPQLRLRAPGGGAERIQTTGGQCFTAPRVRPRTM